MDLLSLMSFFDGPVIPMSLLLSYMSFVGRGRARHGRGMITKSLNRDIALLKAKSLVLTGSDKDTLVMSSEVRILLQAWLRSTGSAQEWEEVYLELIAREFPTGECENWSKCQQLLPHIERFHASSLNSVASLEAWAQVSTNVAWYHWKRGDYERAEDNSARAFRIREKVLGAQDERTLNSLEVLASVMFCKGYYAEAEDLNRQALERRETNAKAGHPSTLTSMSNLALVLLHQGRYIESEELHRRVLRYSEEELGSRHVETLVSASNLALLLRSQCRYSEAEALNRRALEGFRKALGRRHPSTLTSMGNLAVLLQDQGKYKASETLHRRSLRKKVRELGAHHPSTLTSKNNLANVLYSQDEQPQASRREDQAVEESMDAHDVCQVDTFARCVSKGSRFMRHVS